jgi:Phage tail sheath protein FI
MAVQVSYPGVYIEEFTPGAPIEGVSTSVAAFVGVGTQGPIEQPTLIQSWDAFVAIFGGFITTPPNGFLAPSVYGFFQNGGTSCYIVRAGTGKQSTAGLDARVVGPATPVMNATAIAEGPAGDKITITVSDSSILASLMAAAGVAGTTIKPVFASSNIVSLNAARDTLVLTSNAGFAVNDRVHLKSGANNAAALVKALQGPDTLIFTAPVPGAASFAGGTAFIENMVKGRTKFRVNVDPKISLSEALVTGAAVKVTQGPTTEIVTVVSSGGDTVTIANGLANDYNTETLAGLPDIATLEFDMLITDTGSGTSEKFSLLGGNIAHSSYWAKVVNSQLVTLAAAVPPPVTDDLRPQAKVYNLGGGVADNRATAWAAVLNNATKYLDLLRPLDDVSLVAIPGAIEKSPGDYSPQQAIRDHCESMASRFGILDGKPDATPGFTNVKLQLSNVKSSNGFVALYFPWILAPNPVTGSLDPTPPSGHLAGIYARTDQSRGVHKAPANTNIRNSVGVVRRLTNEEQGPLNLSGINILRVFPDSAQPMVWGARTAFKDTNWQYINVRRLFIYLEQSIERGINWAIFEPNNLALWKKLKRSITEFLTRVWRDGALFGETADKAFYVRIDEVLNPPSSMALGRLTVEIGIRPSYPAEFIVVRIGIWQGGSEISES